MEQCTFHVFSYYLWFTAHVNLQPEKYFYSSWTLSDYITKYPQKNLPEGFIT